MQLLDHGVYAVLNDTKSIIFPLSSITDIHSAVNENSLWSSWTVGYIKYLKFCHLVGIKLYLMALSAIYVNINNVEHIFISSSVHIFYHFTNNLSFSYSFV